MSSLIELDLHRQCLTMKVISSGQDQDLYLDLDLGLLNLRLDAATRTC